MSLLTLVFHIASSSLLTSASVVQLSSFLYLLQVCVCVRVHLNVLRVHVCVRTHVWRSKTDVGILLNHL